MLAGRASGHDFATPICRLLPDTQYLIIFSWSAPDRRALLGLQLQKYQYSCFKVGWIMSQKVSVLMLHGWMHLVAGE